jgi:hypothetical protein
MASVGIKTQFTGAPLTLLRSTVVKCRRSVAFWDNMSRQWY